MLANLDVCHCEALDATIIATPEAQLRTWTWTYVTVKFHGHHYCISRGLHFDGGPRTKESANI
jgi:hypothetical protein